MTLRVVWEKLNVEIDRGADDEGRPQYESRILTRGETIPKDVSDFNRSLYISIGAAKDDGLAAAAVKQASDQEFNPPAQTPVLTPDQPPNLTAPSGGASVGGQAPPEDAPPALVVLPARPEDGARKDAWEDYATALGIDRPRAESLTKANLIKEADEKRASLETTPA